MARIVVLDDDETLLALMRTMIEEAGHTAVSAGALEDLEPGTTADVVVTDLIPLKAYDGAKARDWIARLRRRFSAPLIVVTAHAGALAEPDRLGADAVVGKPFDLDEMSALIERHLDRPA